MGIPNLGPGSMGGILPDKRIATVFARKYIGGSAAEAEVMTYAGSG